MTRRPWRSSATCWGSTASASARGPGFGVGTNLDDTVEATADLALVAAGIGDPVGASLEAYVDANPARTTLHVLDQVAYVERALARTPASAASFAYTVDGRRSVVDLAPGRAFTIALTAASARVSGWSRSAGRLRCSRQAGARRSTLPRGPAIRPSSSPGRSRPAGTIPTDRLVVVDLTPTFGILAVHGCYQVVDLVPSGLAPVARTDGWVGDDGTIGPYSIVGQQVSFCASNDPTATRVSKMRYLARVVTAGDYAWEPAIIQLPDAPEAAAFTAPTRVTIADR